MEWVEVEGKTIEEAKVAGLAELGITEDRAVVEIIREPKSGFLGLGGQPAYIKISAKPEEKPPSSSRRRRRRRPSGGGDSSGSSERESAAAGAAASGGKQTSSGDKSAQSGGSSSKRSSGRSNSGRGKGSSNKPAAASSGGSNKPQSSGRKPQSGGRPPKGGSSDGSSRNTGEKQQSSKGSQASNRKAAAMPDNNDDRDVPSIEERAEVAADFVRGLLDAFGLEGTVATEIDDDVLKIDVAGEQTEALVGPKGAVMQSVLEVTRTVVQRKTFGAPRMRIDIAGYAERRREALTIYTGKIAKRVTDDGGEIMLEPMNPADRKVVHDAAGEIDGVRSYSEGEEPERAVVLAPAE